MLLKKLYPKFLIVTFKNERFDLLAVDKFKFLNFFYSF